MTRFASRILVAPALAAALLAASACGTSSHSGSSGGMPGMGDNDMYAGTGLSASASGFTLKATTTKLAAGSKTTFAFAIEDGMGMKLKEYADDQTKLMHFYLIR